MAIIQPGTNLLRYVSLDTNVTNLRATVDSSILPNLSDFLRAQPTYIDGLTSSLIYVRKVAKQPVFNFMITNEDDDFYINTHGVSFINESFTQLNDGKFYILNKNNIPIYFNSLDIDSISLREDIDNTNKVTINKIDTILNGNFIFDDYLIKINENEVGELRLGRLINFENNNNVLVNPQQSIEFSASYKVKNLNNLNIHYFGKTNKSPNRKKGAIDIDLRIKCFGDSNLTRSIDDTLTISVNSINNTEFIINSASGLASGTAQQYLKYSFIKPTTTLGTFTIEKNGVVVRTSTGSTNSATDITILPGDSIKTTITPAISSLSSNITILENGFINQQTINTGTTTNTFTVLNNKTYEIISYLDITPIAPIVRYFFNKNNLNGTLRIFRNNSLFLTTTLDSTNNQTTQQLIDQTISGLNVGDVISARIEPANNARTTLSIIDQSLNSQIYSTNTASGVINQSPTFTLSSGGIYNIFGFLQPAPIVLWYRHGNNVFEVKRGNTIIYQSSGNQVLNWTTLTIQPTYQPGDTITVTSYSALQAFTTTTIEVYSGGTNQSQLITGGSSVSPNNQVISFTAQSGVYYISAFNNNTTFPSTTPNA
jgi:hypothetical protein